ncbi:uncharacterized protein LOC128290555 [Gossypium arboreum]|uniref:uncharacterized protein LOC128290555 n=1 Tax=Gossypium arboreum TaxID=29729 RepID=UPI0022F1BEC4|nr:uncharacterized protein LOC128290555 [Gossypium arboreum]
MGVVKFDDTPSTENLLPNHGDQEVNAIGETGMRRIKEDMAEELEFYEAGSDEGHVCALEGEPKNQRINRPRIIISLPRNNEVETQTAPKVIIHKPASFPYKDNKGVPWNYDCNVTMPEREDIASTSKDAQVEGSYTRSGKRYDVEGVRVEPTKVKAFDIKKEKGVKVLFNEPVKEEEAREFLKFLKHSEYSVVEQLRKQPARISVLALLLSSEVHREALMKVLNKTYVTNDISVNKLDRLVSNISADNFIYFNDDEIPPGGIGSAKALHITTRCKVYTLPSVLIDNGSALNVLPLSTLNRLPIDGSYMKTCHNIVRAFDGTERKVMGRIDILLMIKPNTYEVDFLVMDIKPSYNFLLGRPWIHSAGTVPSSLHQKLKLVTDGRLVTINAEEDFIAVVTSDTPYVEANEEAVECSFHSLKFVNATFISEGDEVPVPKISRTTRMGLQMTVGKGALPGKGLGRYLQGGIQVPDLKEKRDHFGLGFRPDHRQRRKEIEKCQERRRARLSGREVGWELMTFPHMSQIFISEGIIHPKRGLLEKGSHHINADMPGLNTDLMVHRLPMRQDCKPVQQKLRRMRPDIVLKIKDEVKK